MYKRQGLGVKSMVSLTPQIFYKFQHSFTPDTPAQIVRRRYIDAENGALIRVFHICLLYTSLSPDALLFNTRPGPPRSRRETGVPSADPGQWFFDSGRFL